MQKNKNKKKTKKKKKSDLEQFKNRNYFAGKVTKALRFLFIKC